MILVQWLVTDIHCRVGWMSVGDSHAPNCCRKPKNSSRPRNKGKRGRAFHRNAGISFPLQEVTLCVCRMKPSRAPLPGGHAVKKEMDVRFELLDHYLHPCRHIGHTEFWAFELPLISALFPSRCNTAPTNSEWAPVLPLLTTLHCLLLALPWAI